jgi:hypothetical protein
VLLPSDALAFSSKMFHDANILNEAVIERDGIKL